MKTTQALRKQAAFLSAVVFFVGGPALGASEEFDIVSRGSWPGYTRRGGGAVAVSGQYVYLGGLQVLDVSNPKKPWRVGDYDRVSARDLAVVGTYVYAACYTGLDVFDVSDPTNPQRVGQMADEGAVAIAVSGNHAVLVDEEAGVEVVDISNPARPHCVGIPQCPWDYAFSVAISGHYAYVGFLFNGLMVLDISNPAAPEWVGGYGRVAYGVAILGNYAYLASDDRLVCLDISNPRDPQFDWWWSTAGTYTVGAWGNFVYFEDAAVGLQAMDVSEPGSPRLAGHFNPGFGDLAFQGNYIFLGTWEGLTVLDTSDPYRIQQASECVLAGESSGLMLLRDNLYVADSTGLLVLNLAEPTRPQLLANCDTGPLTVISLTNNYAYVAGPRFTVVNISDPQHPAILGSCDLCNPGWSATGIAVAANLVCLACDFDGLRIVDVSDPYNPACVGVYTNGYGSSVVTVGHYACLSSGLILDIADPSNPQLVRQFGHGLVATHGTYGYATEYYGEGLQVFDITNPTEPVWLGKCSNAGCGRSIVFDGQYAYATDTDWGLQVLDMSDPVPRRVGGFAGENEIQYGRTDMRSVAAMGRYVYMAKGWKGVEVFEVIAADPPTLAQYPMGGDYPRAAAKAGNTLAVATGATGVHLLDVASPANPRLTGVCQTLDAAWDIAVSGDYAFVADGAAGLQVIDMSNPTDPRLLSRCPLNGSQHVVLSGTYAFVTDEDAQLHVVDISSPAAPQQIGGCGISATATGLAVSGDYLFVACVADEEPGFQAIDISDPSDPRVIAEYVTLSTQSAEALAVSGDYAYLVTEVGVEVVSIRNPAELTRVGVWTNDFEDAWWPRLLLSGQYAYLTDTSYGFLVLDLSDPATPRQVGGYQSPIGKGSLLLLSGNNAWVSVGATLELLDISDRAHPRSITNYADVLNSKGSARKLAVSGDFAYVANYDSYGAGGLQVFDISNPRSPLLVARCPGTYAYDLALSGNYAYIAENTAGLRVFDISVPTNPRLVGSNCPCAGALCISGAFAYVSSYPNLVVLDVSDPAAPRQLGECYLHGSGSVALSGHYAYVAAWDYLDVVDISNPASPQLVGSFPSEAAAALRISGHFAYIADYYAGLVVYDLANPTNPQKVGQVPIRSSRDLTIADNRLYLASSYGGLHVFDISEPSKPRRLGGNSKYVNLDSVAVSNGMVFLAAETDGLVVLGIPPLVLSIFREQTNVRLSWEGYGPGPTLQHATRLVNPDWQDLIGYERTNGAIFPILSGPEFYRLSLP